MIELRTGIPGSGKTLSIVQALSKLLISWEKKPEDGRPIFVHNIKNLALPHAVMPTKEIQISNKIKIVPDWDSMPDGSLVIIDECQDLIPPRSNQSEMPMHIAWLNTHRHKGFDIWFITQHPKLIDFSVRALVGKHVHYRRLFGGQRAVTYEWDACSDNLSGMKDAVISSYSFPKKAFQWYKSAEIHTKQNFKLPRWLLIPLFGVVISIFTFPSAYSILKNGISGKSLTTKENEKPLEKKIVLPLQPTNTSPPFQSPYVVPTVTEVEPSYPITDLTTLDSKYKPTGCVASTSKCICYGQFANVIEVTISECRKATTQIALLTKFTDSNNIKQTSTKKEIVQTTKTKENSFNDSGFNLPVASVEARYGANYYSGPSGAIYHAPTSSTKVMSK